MLEMGRGGEGRGGEGRGGEERGGEEMMRSLAGTLCFSFLLLFGITEYEITARTSHLKPKNPSPI